MAAASGPASTWLDRPPQANITPHKSPANLIPKNRALVA
jgi:hypothetical protein